MRLIRYFLFGLFVAGGFTCTPDKFQLPAWQAELFLPLLNADFDLSDITFSREFNFTEDSTGFVTFVIQVQDTTPTLEEAFPLDDQFADFTIPGISGALPDFHQDVPLVAALLEIPLGQVDQLDPFSRSEALAVDISDYFTEAEYASGLLGLSLINTYPFELKAGLRLTYANSEESIPLFSFELEENLAPGDSITLPEADLGGRLLKGSTILSLDMLGSPGGSNLQIDPEDALIFRFSFSQTQLVRATLPVGNLDLEPVQVPLPLIFPSGALLQRGALSKGLLEIEFPDFNEQGFRLIIRSLSITANGAPLTTVIGQAFQEVDLTHLVLDLTQQDPPYNIIQTEFELDMDDTTEQVSLFFDRPLDGSIRLTNGDYEFVQGYMGTSEELEEGFLEADLFEQVRSGKLVLEDPRVILEFYNSQGVTARGWDDGGGLYIRGQNPRLHPGEVVEIGQALQSFSLAFPDTIGEVAFNRFVLDAETEPNFGEFLGLLPTRIDYRLPLFIGTEEPNLNQFLWDDGSIAFDLRVELPMNLAADDLLILDTLDFALALDYEDVSFKQGSLRAVLTNSFPLQLELQAYFLDSNQVVLDSLFTRVRNLEPATTNSEGRVIEPLVTEFVVEVRPEQLDLIRRASYIVPVFRLASPEGDFIKLFSDYAINFTLSGDVQLDINSE